MELNLCQNCKHYLGSFVCEAFIDGIPEVIIDGENEHSKPLPNQDNNIVFEPIDNNNEK
jgi:hypothetical protein